MPNEDNVPEGQVRLSAQSLVIVDGDRNLDARHVLSANLHVSWALRCSPLKVFGAEEGPLRRPWTIGVMVVRDVVPGSLPVPLSDIRLANQNYA